MYTCTCTVYTHESKEATPATPAKPAHIIT